MFWLVRCIRNACATYIHLQEWIFSNRLNILVVGCLKETITVLGNTYKQNRLNTTSYSVITKQIIWQIHKRAVTVLT